MKQKINKPKCSASGVLLLLGRPRPPLHARLIAHFLSPDVHRKPHSVIEKQRRVKMNNLIEELSAMIPTCHQKLDKLSVLRKAVQYLKALKGNYGGGRGLGGGHTCCLALRLRFSGFSWKRQHLPTNPQHFHPPQGRNQTSSAQGGRPPALPRRRPSSGSASRLFHVCFASVHQASDSFLMVVTCDRAKILFISKSVTKILNFIPVCVCERGTVDANVRMRLASHSRNSTKICLPQDEF